MYLGQSSDWKKRHFQKELSISFLFHYFHLISLVVTKRSLWFVSLPEKMKVAREALSRTDVSVVSVSSGCELFMRFITLSHLELEQATVSIIHNESIILIPDSQSSPQFSALFLYRIDNFITSKHICILI